MKKVFRTITKIGFVLAMVLGVSTVWANCGTSQLIANYSTGGQLNVPGVLDDGSGTGTIMTKFWLQGKSASFNSGTLKDTFQVLPWEKQSYFIWSNWGDGGVVGGCPPYSGRTVFLYSIENGGRGEYILMSTNMDTNTTWAWDFDAITNGNGSLGPNTEEPVPIPKVSASGVSMESPGVVSAVLNWNPIKNLRGFFDTDPGKNLITGIAIRYYQGANPPTSFRSADWPLAGTVYFSEKGVDVGHAKVELPYSTQMHTYVALSLLIDGGDPGQNGSPSFTETDFVGEFCEIKPEQEPAAEFGSVSAVRVSNRTIRVAWTMVKEIGVENYSIYGSRFSRGRYAKLTTVRSADSGSYSVDIETRKTRGSRFVFVTALLSTGEEVQSKTVELNQGRR